jgi:S1-C subfamily serine protease
MSRRLAASVLVLAVLMIVAVIVVPALGGEDGSNPLAEPTDRTAGGFQDTVARALPSVVLIERTGALGSGVVLDDGGHIVTNAHVVGNARTFTVTTSDGAKHKATLSGAFPQGDLAVIDVQGANLQPATFADSSQVKVSWRWRSATRSACSRASPRASSAPPAGPCPRATASRCRR